MDVVWQTLCWAAGVGGVLVVIGIIGGDEEMGPKRKGWVAATLTGTSLLIAAAFVYWAWLHVRVV